MTIGDLLGPSKRGDDLTLRRAFQKYGVANNPFPTRGQTSGHSRMPVSGVDEKVADAVKEFERGDNRSQIFIVEGQQGVGKTNLLNNYQEALEAHFSEDKSYYIIRYYADPERDFDRIVRKVFQELATHRTLTKVVDALQKLGEEQRESAVGKLRNLEVRVMLRSLVDAASEGALEDGEIIRLAEGWLVGDRLLNRHKDVLGVQFRLDTVESRTQALHDIVFLGADLGVLKGIFLLLDELEKQAGVLPERAVVQYLQAIRALIDALSLHLFMILGITPEARARYFEMLPALQGRLRSVSIPPLNKSEDAIALYRFYQNLFRREAAEHGQFRSLAQGMEDLFSDGDISNIFRDAYQRAGAEGKEGVRQRDFLDLLHELTEKKFASL